MCDHCGCRQIEPIAELMDEHAALRELSGDIRRALATDQTAAVAALAELRRRLDVHVRREECGAFAALKADGEYADQVVELEQEHDDFDQTLAALDLSEPGFAAVVRAMLAEVSEHIDKEDLGIVPVAVVTLGADGWDIVINAHGQYATALE